MAAALESHLHQFALWQCRACLITAQGYSGLPRAQPNGYRPAAGVRQCSGYCATAQARVRTHTLQTLMSCCNASLRPVCRCQAGSFSALRREHADRSRRSWLTRIFPAILWRRARRRASHIVEVSNYSGEIVAASVSVLRWAHLGSTLKVVLEFATCERGLGLSVRFVWWLFRQCLCPTGQPATRQPRIMAITLQVSDFPFLFHLCPRLPASYSRGSYMHAQPTIEALMHDVTPQARALATHGWRCTTSRCTCSTRTPAPTMHTNTSRKLGGRCRRIQTRPSDLRS